MPADDAGQGADDGAPLPQHAAEDGDQQAADQDVVGDGQRGDHVTEDAGDGDDDDTEAEDVPAAVLDLVGLVLRGIGRVGGIRHVAVLDHADDVLLGHGGGGDQGAAGGGHDRGQGGGDDQAGQAGRQHVLHDRGVRVVAVGQVRQDHLRAHADQGAGDGVQQAVEPGGRAGPAGDGVAAGSEDPLPDVLADDQAEEVDHEVGEDGAAADVVERERVGRQAGLEPGEAAGLDQHRWQQDEEDADGLDDELDEVGQRDRPHAAQHRVGHDDGAAEDDGRHLADVEQDTEDRSVRDGRGHREHQGVRPHDDSRDQARAGAVAQFEHLADGVDPQPVDLGGEAEAQQQDPAADGEDEPHAGDAVLVAEADAADGAGTAQHDGGHGAGVEQRSEPAAGDQEVRLGFGAGLGIEADADHGCDVESDHDEVHGDPSWAGECGAG